MTQKSRPWPGIVATYGVDSGPFTADDWWAVWTAVQRIGGLIVEDVATPLRTLTALTNLGVYYSIGNRLATTNPAQNYSVDTGASMVEGTFHYNDEALTISVPAAANVGESRIDKIVIRKNYTGSTYTPTGSTDANEVVPAYSTRITRLVGAEAAVNPVAPSITQATDRSSYWDIPIAQYEIDDGGNISNLTDLREWADAETKTFVANAIAGYNYTTVADIAPVLDASRRGSCVELPDAENAAAGSEQFIVPKNFLENMIVTAILTSDSSGDVRLEGRVMYGACGEDQNEHTDTDSESTETITAAIYNCLKPITLTTPAVDDIVFIRYDRDGADGLDNLTDNLEVCGWTVEYLGWR